MTEPSNKQTALVFGATGNTGSVIVDALVESQNFNVSAVVRPSSQHKASVESMRSRGVSIVLLDLATVSSSVSEYESLVSILRGFDTVIVMTTPGDVDIQLPLVDACKEAGVKRFIPCDAGSACERGWRVLYDQKMRVHDHIEKVGLGHTYVDVGWWLQIGIPLTDPSSTPYPAIIPASHMFYVPSDGIEKKTALTDLRDIGNFFARIIADERTMNRYVFCWGEERTQTEIWEAIEKVVGKKIEKTEVSEDALVASINVHLQPSGPQNPMQVTWGQYMLSIWIRGDNVIENAKKPEYGSALDARELYPDLKVRTLESFIEEIYGASS